MSALIGRLQEDATKLGRGGWIVGSFFQNGGPESSRCTRDLEVKYWVYRQGEESAHQMKTSATTEWTLILSGSVLARIDGESVMMSEGDYALVHPGTPNNLVERVLDDVVALTIKAPSDPTAKQLV